MSTETNQEPTVTAENNGAEETSTNEVEKLRQELSKLSETIGSLKRENKDLKKSRTGDSSQETEPKTEGNQSNVLLEKSFLKASGITDADEVKLAIETARKWGMPIDELVEDDDFQIKLDKVRTAKANALATSGVKGDKSGGGGQKETPEYWLQKGVPPSASDVPDRKTRAKIARAFIEKGKNNGKTFYND